MAKLDAARRWKLEGETKRGKLFGQISAHILISRQMAVYIFSRQMDRQIEAATVYISNPLTNGNSRDGHEFNK